MICPVCKGSGNIVTFARGLEYWPCVCGGAGVLIQHQPAVIQTSGRKRNKGGRF